VRLTCGVKGSQEEIQEGRVKLNYSNHQTAEVKITLD